MNSFASYFSKSSLTRCSVVLLWSLLCTSKVFAFEVRCQEENCHASIGALVAKADGARKSQVCTGVLLAKNIFASNLHCIPDSIRFVGASCKDKVHISFGQADGHTPEIIPCGRILKVSASMQRTLQPDFVVLELDHSTTRPTTPVNYEGLHDNESVTIWKIDPHPTEYAGDLRRIECTAVQNSLLNPFFTQKQDAIFNLVPCSTIQGNSGSPILDADGKVKGLINSNSTPKENASGPFKELKTIPVVYGTNFACFDIYPDGSNPNKCPQLQLGDFTAIQGRRMTEEAKKAKENFEKAVNFTLKNLEKESKGLFRFKVIESGNSKPMDSNRTISEVNFTPQCLLTRRTSIKKEKLRDTPVLLTVKTPTLTLRTRLDEVGRYTYLQDSKDSAINARMVPQDLLKEVVPVSWGTSQLKIPYCP